MWKRVLEKKNRTATEFRKLFKDNTYQSNEVVKEIKIVDSSHTFTPLEKQISMFPEAGEFLQI